MIRASAAELTAAVVVDRSTGLPSLVETTTATTTTAATATTTTTTTLTTMQSPDEKNASVDDVTQIEQAWQTQRKNLNMLEAMC